MLSACSIFAFCTPDLRTCQTNPPPPPTFPSIECCDAEGHHALLKQNLEDVSTQLHYARFEPNVAHWLHTPPLAHFPSLQGHSRLAAHKCQLASAPCMARLRVPLCAGEGGGNGRWIMPSETLFSFLHHGHVTEKAPIECIRASAFQSFACPMLACWTSKHMMIWSHGWLPSRITRVQ